jgi:hypothetical protein
MKNFKLGLIYEIYQGLGLLSSILAFMGGILIYNGYFIKLEIIRNPVP